MVTSDMGELDSHQATQCHNQEDYSFTIMDHSLRVLQQRGQKRLDFQSHPVHMNTEIEQVSETPWF
jgi:hypothetical protein